MDHLVNIDDLTSKLNSLENQIDRFFSENKKILKEKYNIVQKQGIIFNIKSVKEFKSFVETTNKKFDEIIKEFYKINHSGKNKDLYTNKRMAHCLLSLFFVGHYFPYDPKFIYISRPFVLFKEYRKTFNNLFFRESHNFRYLLRVGIFCRKMLKDGFSIDDFKNITLYKLEIMKKDEFIKCITSKDKSDYNFILNDEENDQTLKSICKNIPIEQPSFINKNIPIEQITLREVLKEPKSENRLILKKLEETERDFINNHDSYSKEDAYTIEHSILIAKKVLEKYM